MNNKEFLFKQKIEKLVSFYNANNFKYVIQQSVKLLDKFPNSPFIYNLLGSSFQKIGDHKNARKAFFKALDLDENNLAAMNNLGNTLKNTKEFVEAEKYYQKILKIDANYINALINYGGLKFDLNEHERAIDLYNQALKIDNNTPLLHHNIALAYLSLGDFKKSEFHFKEILRIDPRITSADKFISKIVKYKAGDKHLEEMKNKLNGDLGNLAKVDLYFALGKAHEDFSDFEKSFFYLEKGNSLKKKITNYDKAKDNKLFDNIKKTFQDFDFEDFYPKVEKKNKLIFIVGLPRSGTSLIEQILASHSNVYGSGELSYLDQSIHKYFDIYQHPVKMLNNDKKTTIELLKKTAQNYTSLVDNFKINKEFITDKAPLNFMWIGFIRTIFPDAKIVHVSRDPKDNCLSLYKNVFDANLNWTYSQKDISNYYLIYSDLMKFWNNKIPSFIYNIRYDKLIDNTKSEIEKLLEFCDLKWEDNCLNYFKTKRSIKTVSATQARKPIYKSSVNSSKNYEMYLKDLFSLLNT